MHKYNTKGELVPAWEEGFYSPTTILDVVKHKKIFEWRELVGPEEAEQRLLEAAALGTGVHKALEAKLAGEEPVVTGTTRPYIGGFDRWVDKKKPEIIASEIFVVSARHKYAGTTDLICRVDGQLWLVDFKTSKSYHDTMGLQLAAYRQAWWEMTGEMPKTAILKLTDKTQKGWQWREYKEPIGVFLGVKKYFDWEIRKNPPKAPNEYTF